MGENSERGALTEAVFYILLSMFQPMCGYAVIRNTAKLSGGRVALGTGTLYGAINTLLEKGWIVCASEGASSRNKKEYVTTELGRAAVRAEIERLEELLRNAKAIEESSPKWVEVWSF